MTFLSQQVDEVQPLFVYYKGKLYDVSAFADKHPGGRKVLERVAGNEVEKFMDGEERIMGVKHQHSEAALEMLERYSMDQNFKVTLVSELPIYDS